MDRRQFLTVLLAGSALSGRVAASRDLHDGPDDEQPRWRTFEITTRVHVLQPSGPTRVWLPMPLAVAPYQKTLGDTYQVSGGTTSMVESEDVDILVANWDAGVEPILTITNRVATTAYAANLATPTVPPPLDLRPFARFLRLSRNADAAELKEAADRIAHGAGTDVERASAIFSSVAERSASDPAGAALRMTALARASSIPARSVWGLRVSRADATRAQECRVEVYLTGYGWVPIDPAGKRFGAWDADWVAYNAAQDVVLPGSKRAPLTHLAYPQAETIDGRRDAQSPDTFKYDIAAREVDPSPPD